MGRHDTTFFLCFGGDTPPAFCDLLALFPPPLREALFALSSHYSRRLSFDEPLAWRRGRFGSPFSFTVWWWIEIGRVHFLWRTTTTTMMDQLVLGPLVASGIGMKSGASVGRSVGPLGGGGQMVEADREGWTDGFVGPGCSPLSLFSLILLSCCHLLYRPSESLAFQKTSSHSTS